MTSTDRLLFPAANIESVPQPDFVKDLIADEELLEFQMGTFRSVSTTFSLWTNQLCERQAA